MSGDTGEKTEEPTPKKLRDLRKKGQVPKSKEVVSTSLIVVIFAYMGFALVGIINSIESIILIPVDVLDQPFELALTIVMDELMEASARITIPFLGIVVSVGILANIMQTGVMFSVEPLKPDIKKIDPIQGFKKIFSQNNFIEFIKSIIKVLAVSTCVAYVIAENIESLIYTPTCKLECFNAVFGAVMKQMLTYVCAIFIFVAMADLGYQRYDFINKNKMTKDEVKRDYKESEGDPAMKGKRKKLQRELASGKAIESVKRASVVVKNPTHFAVAIRYDAKDTPLPMVLAKGQNSLAKKIIEVAEENGIPIMENVPLARGLYAEADVDSYIPIDFIPAVVEVLHWVKEHHADFVQSE